MSLPARTYSARPLAFLLIALYALASVVPAFAGHHTGAGSIFICAPSGQLSDEARQAAAEFAALFGEDLPDEAAAEADCPLCTLAKAHNAAASAKPVLPLPTRERVDFGWETQDFGDKAAFRRAHPRGPPLHI